MSGAERLVRRRGFDFGFDALASVFLSTSKCVFVLEMMLSFQVARFLSLRKMIVYSSLIRNIR
jgi:hypothetical protein